MPHCPRCPAVWQGVETICHCGACCRTFAGVGLFDQHRDHNGEHGRCLDPATVPELHYRDGMWRGPERAISPRSRAGLSRARVKGRRSGES